MKVDAPPPRAMLGDAKPFVEGGPKDALALALTTCCISGCGLALSNL
jgi:hypothetical protein